MHPGEKGGKERSHGVATMTHRSAVTCSLAAAQCAVARRAARRPSVRSNLLGTLGRGLDRGPGEVRDTYFPLQPESVAPRAGKGIQAV